MIVSVLGEKDVHRRIGQYLPDVSSGPNFYNIDARIKLFNSFFIYGQFVVHCNHLFHTAHPPYVLASTKRVFTVLALTQSIFIGLK